MLCDKCKKNVATFHKTVMINGEGYETHLCSECANMEDSFIDPFDIFNLPAMFVMDDDLLLEESKHCPTCNSTFVDFLKRGKLGCKDCYATFEPEIRDMLENMQSPIDFDLDEFIESTENAQLKQLEADFKKAIEEERYEDAGKIKGQITKLKNDNNAKDKEGNKNV